jgi:hypothetical protein
MQRAEFQSEQVQNAMKHLLKQSASRPDMQDGALTKKVRCRHGARGCSAGWHAIDTFFCCVSLCCVCMCALGLGVRGGSEGHVW